MSKDYYKILEISKNASKGEIKQAYRRLAHQYHPDKKQGDEKKFKEINEAYQVLSDDQKRQQYDQFGTTFEYGASGFDFSGFQGVNFEDFFKGFRGQRINLEDLFSDIFSDIFSAQGGQAWGWDRTRPRGKNIVVDMELNLEDVLKGIEKQIKLEDLNIKLKIRPRVSPKMSKEIKKLIKKLKKEYN